MARRLEQPARQQQSVGRTVRREEVWRTTMARKTGLWVPVRLTSLREEAQKNTNVGIMKKAMT